MSNEHYKISVDGTKEDFIQFVKKNNEDTTDEEIKDIDFLAQRVALNLFYYENNVPTAKSDYIQLIGLLMRKGVIFENETNPKTIYAIRHREGIDEGDVWGSSLNPDKLLSAFANEMRSKHEFFKDKSDKETWETVERSGEFELITTTNFY